MRTEGTASLSVWMVECFAPGASVGDIINAAEHLAKAAEDLDVGYLGALAVPQDELAFHVFHAATADVVLEASRRAGLRVERVVPSILLVTSETDRPVASASGQLGP